MADGKYIWKDRKRTFLGLPWSFTVYAVDEGRIYIKRGLFNTTEDEVRLYRVTDVSLSRSFGQKLVGVGTIHVSSADKTLGDFDIKSIKKPSQVKELISELVEKERDMKRVSMREQMGGPGPAPHFDDDNDEDGDGFDGDERF